MELARKKSKFLADEGAALLVDCSTQGDGGTLFVAGASVPGAAAFPMPGPGQPAARRVSAWDKDAPKIPPQIVVAKEHYNRLVRMIEQGEKLKMAVDLSVAVPRRRPDGLQHDRRDPRHRPEGRGRHAGRPHGFLAQRHRRHRQRGRRLRGDGGGAHPQGARPQAAADDPHRPLERRGAGPPRLARLRGPALRQVLRSPWPRCSARPKPSAEKKESSSGKPASSEPKPEYAKFSAYFNLDNGTGKIRGVYLQGNEAVRPIFRKWLQPFREMGATTLTISNTGGTDHQSFDGIGLPGFQFIQDEIDYDTRTHHSNQDVYDQIQADDMKQAAVIMASFVYNTAMTRREAAQEAGNRADRGKRAHPSARLR